MTDLKNSAIICSGMSSAEVEMGGSEEERKHDERIQGIITAVFASSVEYLLCCVRMLHKESRPYLPNDKQFTLSPSYLTMLC